MMIDLYNGDCLKVMKGLPDNSIDMVLTDPPYGTDYQSNRRVKQEKFDKISNDDNLDWLGKFYSECYRLMKSDTSIYCFCSWHHIDKFKTLIESKFKLKNLIVWNKNNHGSGDLKGSYAPKHEFVLYAHKGRSIFREKRLPDVMEFPKINSNKLLHPTEKNIDMLKIFVGNNTDGGQVILDPFMGSGTTGVAAKNLGRSFVGIELDKGYFKIAEDRINSA